MLYTVSLKVFSSDERQGKHNRLHIHDHIDPVPAEELEENLIYTSYRFTGELEIGCYCSTKEKWKNSFQTRKAIKAHSPPPDQRVNSIKTSFFDFKVALISVAVALAPPKFNHLLLTQILELSENFNKIHP